MFISGRSPSGGMRLTDLMPWPTKPENAKVDEREEMEHAIFKDYHCLCIGYLMTEVKPGEKIWIKPSEAYDLYIKLKREFLNEDEIEQAKKKIKKRKKASMSD